MKVAVSIPDPVFAEAEQLAARFKTSRSELYTRALRRFVAENEEDDITARMNAVIDIVGSEPSAFTKEAARQVLSRVEW